MLVFAMVAHEYAHAVVALHQGDDTAYSLGRVTLNPLPHIDPWMSLILPTLLWFGSGGRFTFGGAKPVPVNFGNLRHPKRDMVWVALAGPASNFVQALLWAVILVVLAGSGVQERFFIAMAQAGILVNLVMWAFNLFPLPPLDGGRILVGLLPWKQAQWVARIEPWGFFVVMGLVIAGVVSTFWLRPLMSLGYGVINILMVPLLTLLR